jgi:hypothetical protein
MENHKMLKWLLAAMSLHQHQEIQPDEHNSVLCGLMLDEDALRMLKCEGKANSLCIRIQEYPRDLLICLVKVALTETTHNAQHVIDSCGFPPAQRTRAMVMCNQVNDTIVAGRFMVDAQDGELYMEMPLVLHGNVEEDERMFSEVMGKIEFTVCRYVPIILKGAQGDTSQAMKDVVNASNLPRVLPGFEFTSVRISMPLAERSPKLPFGKVVSMGEALGAADAMEAGTETAAGDADQSVTKIQTIDLSQESSDDRAEAGPSSES